MADAPSDALGRAIERVVDDAARAASATAANAIRDRLAELEERLAADLAAGNDVHKKTAESVLNSLTEMNVDLNHVLVTITQALAATNQRLKEVEASIGERIDAVQDKLVSGDKNLDSRLDIATQHFHDAVNKFGLARQESEQHRSSVEGMLRNIDKSVGGVSSKLTTVSELGDRLSSLEPRVDNLVPKIDAAPAAVRALEERLATVELAQRDAAVGLKVLRTQSIVLIALVATVALAVATGLVLFAR